MVSVSSDAPPHRFLRYNILQVMPCNGIQFRAKRTRNHLLTSLPRILPPIAASLEVPEAVEVVGVVLVEVVPQLGVVVPIGALPSMAMLAAQLVLVPLQTLPLLFQSRLPNQI